MFIFDFFNFLFQCTNARTHSLNHLLTHSLTHSHSLCQGQLHEALWVVICLRTFVYVLFQCTHKLAHTVCEFIVVIYFSVLKHARTHLLTQSVRVRKCVRFCEFCLSLMFWLLCCFCFSECTHVRGGGGICEHELYLIPFVSIQCTCARNPHSLPFSHSL